MAQQTQSQKGTAAKKQKVVTKKKKAATKGVMTTAVEPSQPERHHMIAEVAYRIAEQRGFEGDRAMDDWLQAEAEVNARFEVKH